MTDPSQEPTPRSGGPTIGRRSFVGVGAASLFSAAVGFAVLLIVPLMLDKADTAVFISFWSMLFAFFGILASLFVTLSLASRLDRVWRLVRRAAGHEQREGALTRIFGASAVIALVLFGFWFLIIQGPAPDIG